MQQRELLLKKQRRPVNGDTAGIFLKEIEQWGSGSLRLDATPANPPVLS